MARRINCDEDYKYTFYVFSNRDSDKVQDFVDHLVETLEAIKDDKGRPVNGFNPERDMIPGRNVIHEHYRLLRESRYSFFVIDPSFMMKAWDSYLSESSLQALTVQDPRTEGHVRFILITLEITKEAVIKKYPQLNIKENIHFQGDYTTDERKWTRLKRAVKKEIEFKDIEDTIEFDRTGVVEQPSGGEGTSSSGTGKGTRKGSRPQNFSDADTSDDDDKQPRPATFMNDSTESSQTARRQVSVTPLESTGDVIDGKLISGNLSMLQSVSEPDRDSMHISGAQMSHLNLAQNSMKNLQRTDDGDDVNSGIDTVDTGSHGNSLSSLHRTEHQLPQLAELPRSDSTFDEDRTMSGVNLRDPIANSEGEIPIANQQGIQIRLGAIGALDDEQVRRNLEHDDEFIRQKQKITKQKGSVDQARDQGQSVSKHMSTASESERSTEQVIKEPANLKPQNTDKGMNVNENQERPDNGQVCTDKADGTSTSSEVVKHENVSPGVQEGSMDSSANAEYDKDQVMLHNTGIQAKDPKFVTSVNQPDIRANLTGPVHPVTMAAGHSEEKHSEVDKAGLDVAQEEDIVEDGDMVDDMPLPSTSEKKVAVESSDVCTPTEHDERVGTDSSGLVTKTHHLSYTSENPPAAVGSPMNKHSSPGHTSKDKSLKWQSSETEDKPVGRIVPCLAGEGHKMSGVEYGHSKSTVQTKTEKLYRGEPSPSVTSNTIDQDDTLCKDIHTDINQMGHDSNYCVTGVISRSPYDDYKQTQSNRSPTGLPINEGSSTELDSMTISQRDDRESNQMNQSEGYQSLMTEVVASASTDAQDTNQCLSAADETISLSGSSATTSALDTMSQDVSIQNRMQRGNKDTSSVSVCSGSVKGDQERLPADEEANKLADVKAGQNRTSTEENTVGETAKSGGMLSTIWNLYNQFNG